MNQKKLGRNDVCHCGSKKKYKNCCLNTDENNKQLEKQEYLDKLQIMSIDESSNEIKECMNILSIKCDKYIMIDITNYINKENYRPYQLKFYNKKTILFAKKTENSLSVFASREDTPLNDIMIMYNGQYRTFQFKNLEKVINSIYTMIL
jgi:hypothetical protein